MSMNLYLTFNEYEEQSSITATYAKNLGEGVPTFIYPALGLAGESGEVVEKFKKIIRDKNGTLSSDDRIAIAKELGDVLWYVAALCREIGIEMESVAHMNIEKIMARLDQGKIHGNGDNREVQE